LSQRRIIWRKAVEANHLFLSNQGEGDKKFVELVEEYGDDGMIYYEWGEAFEFHNDFKSAIFCYRKSRNGFKHVDYWKLLAMDGISRARLKKKRGWEEMYYFGQWTVYHQIHYFNNIDALIKFDALIALTLYDSEPRITALLLRACLESIIISLLPKFPEYKNDDLEEKIIELQKIKRLSENPLDPVTFEHMNRIRKIGNDAAHPFNRKHFDFAHFQESVRHFVFVGKWANEEPNN
jgi:hypothetical protein